MTRNWLRCPYDSTFPSSPPALVSMVGVGEHPRCHSGVVRCYCAPFKVCSKCAAAAVRTLSHSSKGEEPTQVWPACLPACHHSAASHRTYHASAVSAYQFRISAPQWLSRCRVSERLDYFCHMLCLRWWLLFRSANPVRPPSFCPLRCLCLPTVADRVVLTLLCCVLASDSLLY